MKRLILILLLLFIAGSVSAGLSPSPFVLIDSVLYNVNKTGDTSFYIYYNRGLDTLGGALGGTLFSSGDFLAENLGINRNASDDNAQLFFYKPTSGFELLYWDKTGKRFVLTDSVRIEGTLSINDAFRFPVVDGSINQVLTTDGSGVVTWETPPGAGGGEANTTSDAGAGFQISQPKAGVDLPFKTFTADAPAVYDTTTANILNLSMNDADDDGTTKGVSTYDNAMFDVITGEVFIVTDGHPHTTSSISGLLSADMGDEDHGDFTYLSGTATINTSAVTSTKINNGTIEEIDLNANETPAALDLMTYTVSGGNRFSWQSYTEVGMVRSLVDTGTFNGTEGFGLAQTKVGTEARIRGIIEGTGITIAYLGDTAITITSTGGTGLWNLFGDSAISFEIGSDSGLYIILSNEKTTIAPGQRDTLQIGDATTTVVLGPDGATIIDTARVKKLYLYINGNDSAWFDSAGVADNDIWKYDAASKSWQSVAETGGSGTADSVYFNTEKTTTGTEYKSTNNLVKVRPGINILITREDSTTFDMIRINADTSILATLNALNDSLDNYLDSTAVADEVGDTAAILRVEVGDTANILRAEMPDTANIRYDSAMAHLDGMAYDKPTLTIVNAHTPIGVVLEMEKEGGGDMIFRLNGADHAVDCITGGGTGGKSRVVLTVGSDANTPQINYIFVKNVAGTATLLASTSLPADSFAWVGKVVIADSTTFNSDGVLLFQRFTEAFINDFRGTESHAREKERLTGAHYFSGIEPFSLSIDVGTAVPDTVHLLTSAGLIYQLHRQTFPSFTTGHYHYGNGLNIYEEIEDLSSALSTQDGTSMSGKRFVLTVWGAVNKTTGNCKLFVNLPNDFYNSNSNAIADINHTADFTIPNDFKSVGFLIAKIVLRHQTASGGTWTELAIFSLLGNPPGTRVGGVSAGVSSEEFDANLFRVFDPADPTKLIAFDADAISSGNTRTYVFPDVDDTLVTVGRMETEIEDSLNEYSLTSDILLLTDTGAYTITLESLMGDSARQAAADSIALALRLTGGDIDSLKVDTLIVDDKADFSAATLELPQATSPAPTNEGELIQDTDDDQLVGTDGTIDWVWTSKIKTAQSRYWSPDLITDTLSFLYVDSGAYPNGIVVTSISFLRSDTTGQYDIIVPYYTAADPPVLSDYIDTLLSVDNKTRASSVTFENSVVGVGERIYILLPSTDIDWVEFNVSFYVRDN